MNFYLQLSIDWRFIMRITLSQLIIILILTGISYAAPSKAQGVLNNKVSIGSTSTSLSDALKQIERAANVKFVFSKDLIDLNQNVVLSASSQKLSEVLTGLLSPIGVKYDLVSEQIVLSRAEQPNSKISELKDVVVNGKVTDSKGEPLIGVSVKVKGSTQGAATDINGGFSLKLRDDQTNVVLVFAYIGYVTKEVLLSGQRSLTVQLEENVRALDEVVVVGYNTIKKSDVTGAVSRVGAETIEKMPVSNAVQALQGRAAGVDVSSNSRPGEVGSIRIRGNRSVLASNEPLYVVDGIPLAAGGIEAFNPNDIETMDVLKDASAAAIYGSRGANGVVMITTKKGKNGVARVSYNVNTRFEYLKDLDEMFNSGEYAEYRREAYRNFSKSPTAGYSTAYPNPVEDKRILGTDPFAWENIAQGYTWIDKANLIAQKRATTAEEKALWGAVDSVPVYDGSRIPTTNWTDYVSRTGVTQDHTIGVSMGTEKMNSYLSVGYLNQLGTNKGQDYNRYSTKASLDMKPNSWFSLGGTINGSWSKQNYGYAGTGSRDARTLYSAARGMLPFASPFDNNGDRIYLPGADVNIVNPILEHEYVINERTALRALGSFYAEANPLKGLKLRVNYGPDFRNYRLGEFRDKRAIQQGGGAPSSVSYARMGPTQNFAWTFDNLIYYDNTFASKHNVGLTLLHSMSSDREESSSMTAENLPYNSQLWYNLKSTSKGALNDWGSGYSLEKLRSYMARINYGFNSKYLLTLSSRWDGSSKFQSGYNWDFFPSAAAAWRLDSENFMKEITWVSQLKARVGVGVTGQSSIDPYGTWGNLVNFPIVFGTAVQTGYLPSDPKGAAATVMPNPTIRWEKTTQWNYGLDFGFLKNKVSGTLEYYTSKTNDLLFLLALPSALGYPSTYSNIGITANKGVELTLSTTNINSKKFRWDTDFNISTNRDRWVKTSNGNQDLPLQNFFIGRPINVFYDYKKIGIWQTADAAEMKKFNDNGATYKAGDIRVEDINGDYKIDANNDRQVLGSRFPKWTSGITNTFNYRNWDLSFFVYARWDFLIEGGAVDMQGRYAARKVNYWTPNNPTNEYPRADFGNGGQPIHYSSMNYQKGDFLKVRNINIGYTLPKKFQTAAHLNNLKVYAQILNPYLYTKNGIIDPDVSFTARPGVPSNSPGYSTSLVFGLNAGF